MSQTDESSDRGERAQTLEQLGDLYVELDDEAQALKAYSDAHKASAAPSEEQVGLLEKTLKLQRSRGDSEGAAETSALLIDLVKDPKERAERRRDVVGIADARIDEAIERDIALSERDHRREGDERAREPHRLLHSRSPIYSYI